MNVNFGRDNNHRKNVPIQDAFGASVPEKREAIYFLKDDEDYAVNPIYKLDETPNTPERFVIVKTTAGGKYASSGMLHYIYNGIDIITDDTNAIFVDTINKTVFIRDHSKAIATIDPVNPEKRQYVLMLYSPYEDEDEFETSWESITGRMSTYDYIKSHVGTFDPDKSVILTENVALKDALTVKEFVLYLHNNEIVSDDFDIEYWCSDEE